MFCPKCGSILLPKKESGKKVLHCGCGYKSDQEAGTKLTESVDQAKAIEIIDEEVETLPLTDAECDKCGHAKAYYWLQQTRAGDEPETKFLKCAKCKHQWRDYS